MSLESWKLAFYPVEAASAANDALEAAEHSLKKWLGLRTEALVFHAVSLDPKNGFNAVCEGEEELVIAGESCALCVFDSLNRGRDKDGWLDDNCTSCPLHEVLGFPCFGSDDGDEGSSPFEIFCDSKDPGPMIEALEKTVAFVKSAQGGEA